MTEIAQMLFAYTSIELRVIILGGLIVVFILYTRKEKKYYE
jgi:hypothetical protein